MFYTGIDIGSKTIKAVVLQEKSEQRDGFAYTGDNVVFETCRTHASRVYEALGALLDDLETKFGDAECKVSLTGSGALGLAKRASVPFVQEVVALRYGVQAMGLDADAAIEIGGEDSKAVFLRPPLEQRMNTSCAGGTGSFLEDAATLLGVEMAQLDELAGAGSARYQVASRCAVFALRDLKPLVNSNAARTDIAASVYASVVDQTLATLCAGRQISGRVLFLGGPFEHLPNLVASFAAALKLDEGQAIKPPRAQLVCAHGAATYAASSIDEPMTLSKLKSLLVGAMSQSHNDDNTLAPLKCTQSSLTCGLTQAGLKDAKLPLYVGFDLGSSSAKIAVVDSLSRLVFSRYELSPKSPEQCARRFWSELTDELEQLGLQPHDCIAGVASCGYGEAQVASIVKDCQIVPETSAHLRAAVEVRPDATFVLDIGGQDMKAMWVKDGCMQDVAVNESCSSGCGAFVSNAADTLGVAIDDFDTLALDGDAPVDLGTRCTVFMRSRIRQSQERGASAYDIAAGAAHSVARNALHRLVGRRRMQTLGDVVVVQGGAFESDAVLAAFTAELKREVVRLENPALMGAAGAALIAKDSRQENQVTQQTSASDAVSDKDCELAPNTAAYQQELLASYGEIQGKGCRGQVKVGIVNALNDYEALPFWHTCLSELGFSVVVASSCTVPISRSQVAATLMSDTVCLPAQLANKRMLQVVAAGATCALCPSSDEAGMCSVTREYQETLPDAMSQTVDIPVLVPKLGNFSPRAMDRRVLEAESLRSSLEKILPEGDSLSTAELERAVRAGQDAYSAFVAQMEQACQEALDWVHARPERHGIVLSGRSYHLDPELLGGIDTVLQREGFAVIAPIGVYKLTRELRQPFINHEIFRYRTWMPAKRILGFAAMSIIDDQLDCIFLQSFGCGLDAVSHVDAQRMLEENGRPFTLIKLDAKSDDRHTRIRVRALAAAIRNRRASQMGKVSSSVQPNDVAAQQTELSGRFDMKLAPPYDASKPVVRFDGLTEEDRQSALRDFPSDLCSTATLLAGYAVRKAKENPGLRIELPLVCEGCVLESVQHFVTLAGCNNNIEWVSDWPHDVFAESTCSANGTHAQHGKNDIIAGLSEAAAAASTQPATVRHGKASRRIGICANPLILFDQVANQGVLNFIREAGVQPVFPELYSWYSDVAHYIPQLDSLAAQGVRNVLILQSFLCLKGHVYMRGSMSKLKELYPQMRFTVLDLDLSASTLNVANRVLLAIGQMEDDVNNEHAS